MLGAILFIPAIIVVAYFNGFVAMPQAIKHLGFNVGLPVAMVWTFVSSCLFGWYWAKVFF